MEKSIEEKTTFQHGGRVYKVPGYMIEGILNYINHYIKPGDFLTKVLENDLVGACSKADDRNMANIPAYAAYLYSYAPRACWGSPEAVKNWIDRKGEK